MTMTPTYRLMAQGRGLVVELYLDDTRVHTTNAFVATDPMYLDEAYKAALRAATGWWDRHGPAAIAEHINRRATAEGPALLAALKAILADEHGARETAQELVRKIEE